MTADNRTRLVASYQFIAGGWEEDKDLTSQSSDKFTTGLSRQSDRILLVLGAKLLVVTDEASLHRHRLQIERLSALSVTTTYQVRSAGCEHFKLPPEDPRESASRCSSCFAVAATTVQQSAPSPGPLTCILA